MLCTILSSRLAGVPAAGSDAGIRAEGRRGWPQTTRWGAEAADALTFALYSIPFWFCNLSSRSREKPESSSLFGMHKLGQLCWFWFRKINVVETFLEKTNCADFAAFDAVCFISVTMQAYHTTLVLFGWNIHLKKVVVTPLCPSPNFWMVQQSPVISGWLNLNCGSKWFIPVIR